MLTPAKTNNQRENGHEADWLTLSWGEPRGRIRVPVLYLGRGEPMGRNLEFTQFLKQNILFPDISRAVPLVSKHSAQMWPSGKPSLTNLLKIATCSHPSPATIPYVPLMCGPHTEGCNSVPHCPRTKPSSLVPRPAPSLPETAYIFLAYIYFTFLSENGGSLYDLQMPRNNILPKKKKREKCWALDTYFKMYNLLI